MLAVPWIAADDHDTPFPDVEQALAEPDGLLAIGGPLSPARLEQAYRRGIFPWFSANQPVLWWAPSTRAIMRPGRMHLSRSLRKRLRRRDYRVSVDVNFPGVIGACAAARPDAEGTWITPSMRGAYTALHERGIAHSIEVSQGARLVGGLYGVSLGGAFFGESMFSSISDGSKIALAWLHAQLGRWGFELIDCQMPTEHLLGLGAECMNRATFTAALEQALRYSTRAGVWSFDDDLDPLSAGDRTA
jgi:leucyl/phenylalanyl-tRNA--protein transferase